MFGTGLIVIGTLLHLYAFWRLAGLPAVRARVPLPALLGGGALLWALLVAGRTLGHGAEGPAAAALELVGMTYLAALFLTTICLLAVDLATGFGLFLRHRRTLLHPLRAGALAAGAALSGLALVQGFRPPVVERFEVVLPGLPAELDGTVVAGLSDLHLGSLLGERWLGKVVARVNGERPDSVVLLGDLFEGHGAPPPRVREALGRLSAPMGVWAVPGNHDGSRRNGEARVDLSPLGITELRDRWVEAAPHLVLAGVEDMREPGSAAAALAGRPPGTVILLSHYPAHPEAAARAGVGLMLSGHTHGGQLWPFGYLTATEFPLLDGLYRLEGMTLLVSRGAGTWGPRMRLWRPAQIPLVTLRAGT